MIDGQAMAALIGKSSDSPEMQAFLRQVGAKGPKLKKGDTSAYVVLNKEGLELTFTDEAFLTGKKGLAIGEGKLLLVAVRFKAASPPKVAAFAGAMPHGLSFASSPNDLRKQLGKSIWDDPDLAREGWRVDGHIVSVGYDDQRAALEYVSVELPSKYNQG